MRSIGLFAAHRDSEALAAIDRAAAKPRFDDYIADEVHSRWRIRELMYGRESAVQRAVPQAAVLFPHYARLRAVTRVAIHLAGLIGTTWPGPPG